MEAFMTIPAYLPYYVLTGSAGIIVTLLFGLRAALRQANWREREAAAVLRGTAIILIGWFLLAAGLGISGTFDVAVDQLPTIQYAILVPIIVGAWLIFRSPLVARIIDAVPQSWIVGIQLYRALGVIFLILYASEKLPGAFAWPAGLGDVLVGVLAPVIAVVYARYPDKNGDLVAAWNIFGILDLMVAVGTGFITSPSPFQLTAFEAPNELITAFPLVLIPTYLVPLSILLHVASLAKLRRSAAATANSDIAAVQA
jgi:hypothetical protein